ncbi:MAG: carbohydrate porin [Endomicrobium sp.]|nr:carbohydrate porin [Endomicrobium sp.]
MRRKVTALLAASSLLVSNTVFAADSVSKGLGIKTDIGGTVIMQGTPEANDGKNKGLSAASYLFDVKLTKEFEENGKVVVRFKGGRGAGLEVDENGNNGVNTYGQVNANADESLDSAANTLAKVVELYYEQAILNDKLTVDFGKLNFCEFFADNNFAGDDNSQFLTGSFARDKTIDSVPQRPALRLNYVLFEKLDISYAYFAIDLNRFDASGINIAQFNFKPYPNGNYRLYVWGNNGVHYKYNDNTSKSGSYGFGISVDQAVNDGFGVFARCGYKEHSFGNHATGTGTDGKELNNFALPLSVMWSVGSQFNGSKWSRDNDVLGIAIGQIYGSSDAKGVIAEYNNGKYKDGAETQFEVYYKFTLNNHIALTPAFQYFANPRGGNVLSGASTADKNVFVCGVRTAFNF